MLATMFLDRADYKKYGDWLRQQDQDTLQRYFGIVPTEHYFDTVVNKVLANPKAHHFLVAFDRGEWVGVCHIAETGEGGVEFGFIVSSEHRGKGVADRLMDEAMTWAQNRGYDRLFLHCLGWNQPIKKLCMKYNLKMFNESGDTEVDVKLPPPSFFTVGKEIRTRHLNLWTVMFDRALQPLSTE